MNIEALREYTLAKHDVEEVLPFGPDTLVFKVKGKIFLLLSLAGNPVQFNVKCDPDRAIDLREQYSSIVPGYHMNKKHWNTIIMDDQIPQAVIKEMIDHSYTLVAPGVKTRRMIKS